jgi:hypothetical protein
VPAQAVVQSESVLNQERFAQLDALLNRAGMYTKFLTEQMKTYHAPDAPQQQQQQGEQQQAEEEEEEEPEAAAGGKGKGGKRKRGAKAAGSAAKRTKAAEAAAAAAAKGAAAAQAAAGAVSAAGTLAEKQKVRNMQQRCTNVHLPQAQRWQQLAVHQLWPYPGMPACTCIVLLHEQHAQTAANL